MDADSISVVFSFLSMRDFLSAMRVSSQWYSARAKRSAWPEMRLPTLVRALQDGDHDNPERRCRRITIDSPAKRKLLVHSGGVQIWFHATDVKLVGVQRGLNDQEMLEQLASFTCVTSLSLAECMIPVKAAREMYSKVGNRLQSLVSFPLLQSFVR